MLTGRRLLTAGLPPIRASVCCSRSSGQVGRKLGIRGSGLPVVWIHVWAKCARRAAALCTGMCTAVDDPLSQHCDTQSDLRLRLSTAVGNRFLAPIPTPRHPHVDTHGRHARMTCARNRSPAAREPEAERSEGGGSRRSRSRAQRSGRPRRRANPRLSPLPGSLSPSRRPRRCTDAVTSGCSRTGHRMGADGLDVRARQLQPAPVELRAAGRADRVDDVGRGDRAEQPAALSRPAEVSVTCSERELAGQLRGFAEVGGPRGPRGRGAAPRPALSPPFDHSIARPRGTR